MGMVLLGNFMEQLLYCTEKLIFYDKIKYLLKRQQFVASFFILFLHHFHNNFFG